MCFFRHLFPSANHMPPSQLIIFCSRTGNLHIHFHDIQHTDWRYTAALHFLFNFHVAPFHCFIPSFYVRHYFQKVFGYSIFGVKFMENVNILNNCAGYATTKRCRLLLLRAKCEQHDEEGCLKTVSEASLTDQTLQFVIYTVKFSQRNSMLSNKK